MVNADLLHETVQHIRNHPDTWCQLDYRRGPAGCFAYHAALLAGAELASPEPSVSQADCRAYWPNHDDRLAFNEAARKLGFTERDYINISDFARRALGIDSHAADELFEATNTLADLERFVQALTVDSASRRRQ